MQQLRDLSIYILAISAADVVDILLVAALIYALLYVVRGTRAIQLLRGILLLVLLVFLFSQFLSLTAFERVISALLPAILVSVPVIFQPELRRAFERLGRAGLFAARGHEFEHVQPVIDALRTASEALSGMRHGALIVIERKVDLADLIERGLKLDAEMTSDLLVQIFHPNTPLHDGAVILRQGRIAAARVVLPLSDVPPVVASLGTRHLAAVSISETTDALVVVVSEETGMVSLAHDGQLIRCFDADDLGRRLQQELVAPPDGAAQRSLGFGRLGERIIHLWHPGTEPAPGDGRRGEVRVAPDAESR